MQPLDAHQITVKFYADESSRVDPDAAVTIFHRWIQEDRLKDEIAIDVADYRHVGHGPGVVLVCYAADYALAGMNHNGRPSLVYSRKRASPLCDDDPVTRLGAAFRAALTACRFLEEEPTLKGALEFRVDEVSFRIKTAFSLRARPLARRRWRKRCNRFSTSCIKGASGSLSRPMPIPKTFCPRPRAYRNHRTPRFSCRGFGLELPVSSSLESAFV